MAVILMAISLTAAAGVLGSSLTTGMRSQQINHGARFLEGVLSSLEAQPYDALLAMNGNVFYDNGTATRSQHRIELTTSVVGIGLIQLDLVMRQQAGGAEVAHIATLRSQR